jgi:hypothetical protein
MVLCCLAIEQLSSWYSSVLRHCACLAHAFSVALYCYWFVGWRQDVSSRIPLAPSLLLYQAILRTAPGETFLKLLASLDACDARAARFQFAELSAQCWPTATTWRDFVKAQVSR